ncbi:MAG TPA: hypothetical protein VKY66_03370 [Protaetiibacter sp.]|jgi:hypothetical protein|nr:hypothetical protein [Protaetiibacter sp.]
MTETTDRIQDHPLDESTGVNPQRFDADGYVVGRPHHDAVANEDLTPEGTLVSESPGVATAASGITASAAPDAPDGQFHDQRMPATDGELSDATGAPRPDASIAPPPGGDPNAPVPGPEGVPPGPDVTPTEPGAPMPEEPSPFLPDEPGESGEAHRTVGGEVF